MKILWIDDKLYELKDIINYIKSEFDVHFFFAENATHAIETLQKHNFDIVFIDLILPKGRIERLDKKFRQILGKNEYKGRSGLGLLEISDKIKDNVQLVIFSSLPVGLRSIPLVRKINPLIRDKNILYTKELTHSFFTSLSETTQAESNSYKSKISESNVNEFVLNHISIAHSHMAYLDATRKILDDSIEYFEDRLVYNTSKESIISSQDLLRRYTEELHQKLLKLEEKLINRSDIDKEFKESLSKNATIFKTAINGGIFIQGLITMVEDFTSVLNSTPHKLPKEPLKQVLNSIDNIKQANLLYNLKQNLEKIDTSIIEFKNFIRDELTGTGD
ncbi:MAG: hypothetical protein AAF806_26785, partial [Bacteroidota bacterium]